MNLSEDVIDLQRELKRKKEKLHNAIENNLSEDLIREKKLDILLTQDELIKLEQEGVNQQLDDIIDQLKGGTIEETNYEIDANRLKKVMEIAFRIASVKNNILRSQMLLNEPNGERFLKMLSADQDVLKGLEQELNQKASYFLRKFSLHQMYQGLITKETREAIISKEKFRLTDIQGMFENFNGAVTKEKNKQNTKMSKDLAKELLPKSDIENIVHIDDMQTKSLLCQIYNIQNSDDIQIFCVQNNNHTTIGEASGMSKEGYKQLLGEDYNKELGESLTLCVFNKKTGKLEQLEGIVPNILSKGKDIQINKNDGTEIKKEIATISYSGISLTYYLGENGELQIARRNGDKLEKISTETLEHMEQVNQMQERVSKTLESKEQIEIPDTTTAKSPEEFRKFFDKARQNVENARKEVDAIGRRALLEEKEKDERQEILNNERREGKLR